jgi:uncharacterized protein HemX
MDNQLHMMPLQNQPPQPSAAPASTPVQIAKPQPKKRHANKYIYGCLALIILIAVTVCVYTWQHGRVSSLNKQVTELNVQLTNLQKQITKLKIPTQ